MAMKTILVPTDFSPAADNALRLAALLCREQDSEIVLIHVYTVPETAVISAYESEDSQGKNSRRDDVMRRLRKQSLAIERVRCRLMAREGAVVQEIVNAAREQKAKLVIMGTKGQRGLADLLTGTHASNVIERAGCPVMAIPVSSRFSAPIRRITYATDYIVSDMGTLKELVAFAAPFNALINVLHIEDPDVPESEQTRRMSAFIRKAEKEIDCSKVSFQLLHGDDVVEQLNEFFGRGGTDLIAMSTRVRGFFERIFGSSVTRHLAHETSIPLMVFHHRKSGAAKVYNS
jgi:nucleotide-binding universal stress UspA family protein